jgi:hypothetical protein
VVRTQPPLQQQLRRQIKKKTPLEISTGTMYLDRKKISFRFLSSFLFAANQPCRTDGENGRIEIEKSP